MSLGAYKKQSNLPIMQSLSRFWVKHDQVQELTADTKLWVRVIPHVKTAPVTVI
jgi:hypothetical protein